jgi:hypothetical protein
MKTNVFNVHTLTVNIAKLMMQHGLAVGVKLQTQMVIVQPQINIRNETVCFAILS